MRIAFRPLARADFPMLASWPALPHVRVWWPTPEPTVTAVEEHDGPAVDGPAPTRACVIRLDESPVGLIQAYRHAEDPEWEREVGLPGVAGIDYLIGPAEHRGKGVGTAAIRAFAPLVFASYPDVTGIAAVPLAANRASCRALEKAGFRHLDSRDLATSGPSDVGVNAICLLSRPS